MLSYCLTRLPECFPSWIHSKLLFKACCLNQALKFKSPALVRRDALLMKCFSGWVKEGPLLRNFESLGTSVKAHRVFSY